MNNKTTDSSIVDIIKSVLGKKGFALLWMFVENILSSIAQAVWDALWAVMFDAIAEAEKEWEEGDWAKEKKEFVVEKALEYIEDHEKLGWVRKQAVKVFLNIVIDRIIKELNDEIGKDWVEQAKEIEENLDDYFPWIE